VPTEVFRPDSDRSAPSAEDALRLLFVGHWRDSRKGLPVLLQAYRQLQAEGVAVTLDVIGEGTPGAEQRSLPGVTFHGVVSSEGMLAEQYRRCDLFVAPATGQESFGIVLLEAMACSRPVVCSDIRGFRDVIDPEGAVLVAPGDANGLARAIAQLARAPERRRAMGAVNRVRAESFDWDRIAARVREIYLTAVRQ
jgi:phosphatidylinositol alpha-mannosyltransferase